jgi:hypothetical protein
MSQTERTGFRSLLYSGWHRSDRIDRFLGRSHARRLSVIDIDWCEYCCYCSRPIALVETQESTNPPKAARVTRQLALMAGIRAYSVSYQPTSDGDDIELFQVRLIAPELGEVMAMQPNVYAYFLWSLRNVHTCPDGA